MRLLLHLGDSSTQVDVDQHDDSLVLDRATVLEATGWEVKDHGLCRGDVCRPSRLGATLTLDELADALGRPLALEVDGDVSPWRSSVSQEVRRCAAATSLRSCA